MYFFPWRVETVNAIFQYIFEPLYKLNVVQICFSDVEKALLMEFFVCNFWGINAVKVSSLFWIIFDMIYKFCFTASFDGCVNEALRYFHWISDFYCEIYFSQKHLPCNQDYWSGYIFYRILRCEFLNFFVRWNTINTWMLKIHH